jgi:hypothetical protein
MDRAGGHWHDRPSFAHTARRRLPNLLVHIDLREGEPTEPSLFALSEARRIAHLAGATVYAIAMSDRDLDRRVASRLGQAGADKVLLCEGPGLGAPPLQVTHGPALQAAIDRIPPLLVLFGAGGAGQDLGPSLAARIGAAFASRADLEGADTEGPLSDGVGRVFLRRWRCDRSSYRRLDPVEIERPVVAVLAAGQATPSGADNDIDVDVIACAAPPPSGFEEVWSEPDDLAQVPLSRVLVVVDPALGAEARERLVIGAPRGVMVVDGTQAAVAIAASVPEILIVVGRVDLPVLGTPRTRIGWIVLGDAALPVPAFADVLWRVPGDVSDLVWDDLARALGAFGTEPPRRAVPA